MQGKIDLMLDECIKFITLGTPMHIAHIDEFQEIIQEKSREKKIVLHGMLVSPSALLEAAFELNLVKQPHHIGFVERHKLLIQIQASLMSLAHTDPMSFRELKKMWLEKPFAEREEFIKTHSTFTKIVPKLIEAHEKRHELSMQLKTADSPKTIKSINARIKRLDENMTRFRLLVHNVIRTELGQSAKNAKMIALHDAMKTQESERIARENTAKNKTPRKRH
ncbi:MAG: hypothetical protein NUV57_01600 [archaeon]|nr:hypothetical protein [archaeon]